MRIAEGTGGILFTLAVLTVVGFQLHRALGLGLLAFFLFSVAFFRDPERVPPPGPPELVLAPADGTILSVGEVFEEAYLAGPALRISIFMSLTDVHVNRAPVAGEVEFLAHRSGQFKLAWVDKAADENERNDVGFRAGVHKVLCRQIAGMVARRIVCSVKIGDRRERGERYGLIRYGSRLDLFLPPGSTFDVAPGTQVYAGLTPLARLPGSGSGS